MEPFADYSALVGGWPGHPDIDEGVADTLLERASAHLSALLRRHGVAVDPSDKEQAVNLEAVTCSMVRRAMTPLAGDGIASFSQGIGATSASVTLSNPDGSFYLSKADRDLLGIGRRGSARSLRAAIRKPDGSPAEGW